ncbi:MAG: PIG-L family deacetylase [Anaerolineae bacterium]|nr:PIG-L family deacetylase [Anaerolineae bacterium]
MSESQFTPFQTTDLIDHKVLVLAPHPDDESFACGGALILHVQAADPIKIVFLTDGAQADTKNEYDTDAYIYLREQEATNACHLLGVVDFEFWRIPDRTLSANEYTISRLAQLIDAYQPTLVYAPSPFEFHPDHRATASLLWQVVQTTHIKTQLAFYELNRPITINTLINISAVVKQKEQACNVYESQLKYYPYTESTLGLNRYRALTVADTCTYAEGFFLLDSEDIFTKPIETFGLNQIRPIDSSPEKSRPLVSVIIRTKNRNMLLRQALSSVLTQTYPHLEIIVVNDGGEDSTSIMEEFRPHLAIQYIAHDQPRGRAAAANTGLRAAKGKYINFLDDDDLFYADHIEKLAGFLESTGESFAYSDCERGDYQWQGQKFLLHGQRQLFNGVDFDRDRLYFNNYIPLMTAMFTHQLWKKVGPLDEALDCLEDWDLWLRMAQHTTFHHIPGVTAEYRNLVDHNYDNRTWTLKIYDKYRDYWSSEILAKQTWPRIEALQNENNALKESLRRAQEKLEQTQQEHDEKLKYLEQLQTENSGLKDALHQAQENLEQIEQGRETQTQNLETEIAHLRSELTQTQQLLDFIQNSFSWRLTRLVPQNIRSTLRQTMLRFSKK